jgi:glycine dehydrogenase subunit 2
LPLPVVAKSRLDGEDYYHWLTEDDMPQSIGRLSGFMGNAGVLLRAFVYMRLVGKQGMQRIAEFATLNANYLEKRMIEAGFEVAFPDRRTSHEFIVTLRNEAKTLHVTAMDFAKALLDKGMHAPTTYFPLLVPECLLIEPTETETKETADRFVQAMVEIREAAEQDADRVKAAPFSTPVRRLDDVRAARNLDLAYKGKPAA